MDTKQIKKAEEILETLWRKKFTEQKDYNGSIFKAAYGDIVTKAMEEYASQYPVPDTQRQLLTKCNSALGILSTLCGHEGFKLGKETADSIKQEISEFFETGNFSMQGNDYNQIIPVPDASEFLQYVKEAREQFCRFIAALEFSVPLRTEVDSLLICFDQMKERLSQPAAGPDEAVEVKINFPTQIGESLMADFEEDTWTFKMPEDFKIIAGEFALVPLQNYASQPAGNEAVRLQQVIDLKENERQEWADMCIKKQIRIEELEWQVAELEMHIKNQTSDLINSVIDNLESVNADKKINPPNP